MMVITALIMTDLRSRLHACGHVIGQVLTCSSVCWMSDGFAEISYIDKTGEGCVHVWTQPQ